jgi:pyruvate/2-oxoglutarate dehydrogenase complex dihydrolipoamide acyltransferase (E2) component
MSWWVVGISVATTLISAGTTYYGQEQQKKAVEAQADYNEEVAKNEISQENAIATENARRVAKEKNRTISAIRAANWANGLAVEGTPLAVLGDVASEFEQEIADIGYGAANRKMQLLSESYLSRFGADSQKQALGIAQAGTVVSGIGSAAGGYLSASGSVAPKNTSTGLN